MSLVEEARRCGFIPKYTDRRWNCLFGLPVYLAEELCESMEVSETHFLWMLYFLRRYQPESACACWAGVDERCFKRRVMETLQELDSVLPKVRCLLSTRERCFSSFKPLQLQWEDRWEEWDHKSPSCIVDGTPVSILDLRRIPWEDRSRFFSKKKGGPALQYVFAVHVQTGKFVYVSSAYPGGASEITIIEEELADRMEAGEKFLADRLFRFSSRFITSSAHGLERGEERETSPMKAVC